MTALGVVLEVEETLFDTHALRVDALFAALQAEQVVVERDAVSAAHAGVTAAMALDQLPGAAALDDVARSLVLRRAADLVRDMVARGLPNFDPAARDQVALLSTEFPLAVVTRGERTDVMEWLEQADLDGVVRTVRSLGDLPPAAHDAIWREAGERLRTTRLVAVAPPRLLDAAHLAGLHTLAVGHTPPTHEIPWIESLVQLDAVRLRSFT